MVTNTELDINSVNIETLPIILEIVLPPTGINQELNQSIDSVTCEELTEDMTFENVRRKLFNNSEEFSGNKEHESENG